MFQARDIHGNIIEPEPGAEGFCSTCGDKLIPKCGEVMTWHFAHESVIDCDPWAEGETYWHRNWKREVPPSQREFPLGNHRADIIAGDKVIELQHSAISVEDTEARESLYTWMIWVYDFTAHDVAWNPDRRPEEGEHGPSLILWNRERNWQYYWPRPKASILAATKRVFLDLGEDWMFEIGTCERPRSKQDSDYASFYTGARTGQGQLWAKERFIHQILQAPHDVQQWQAISDCLRAFPGSRIVA